MVEISENKNNDDMKAEGLMVGDWLKWNGKPYRVTQVNSIDGGQSLCSMMLENGEEDCGEPIPLVPEILCRNGFIEYAERCFRWQYDDGIYVNVDFTSNMPFVSIHNRCFSSIPISRYVHELQHAMRTCGIEMRIRL